MDCWCVEFDEDEDDEEEEGVVLLFSWFGLSFPPSKGDMWFRDTCSMKEVPYFLKYHHSKIWKRQINIIGTQIFFSFLLINFYSLEITKFSAIYKYYGI